MVRSPVSPDSNRCSGAALNGRSGNRCERGQGMTEFYVMLFTFMVPLFMFIPVLAQISSIRQDAETGIRYATWQRAIWKATTDEIDPNFQTTEPVVAPTTVKSDDTLSSEIDSRIFAFGDAPIYTATTGSTAIQLKPFNTTPLGTPSGQLTSLIGGQPTSTPTNPRYASQTSSDAALSGIEGDLITNALTPFKALRFNLDTEGLVTANLNFSLIQLPNWVWPYEAMGTAPLTMSRSLTLYTDGWNPGGRLDEQYLVSGLLLEELLLDNNQIHALQNKFSPTIAKIIRCNTPVTDCYLDFGYTNVDAVPSSRLTN